MKRKTAATEKDLPSLFQFFEHYVEPCNARIVQP